MDIRANDLGQPIGDPVEWSGAKHPDRAAMNGRFCRVEPIDIETHSADLFAAFTADEEDRIWTYLPYGPFKTVIDMREWMAENCLGDDPQFYVIIDKVSNKAVGVASYLRIMPEMGVIEVGHINYSPALQKTPAATEAMFLLMKRAFSLGNRRYEWKCDALNEGSMRAAERLGFRFEGVFQHAAVYKGRNRDTAWFSVINTEWPRLEKSYVKWLSEENIGEDGQQVETLGALMGNPTV